MKADEFETIDEAWNALVLAREEIARLRRRLGEHDGCSRWGIKDLVALKPVGGRDLCIGCGEHPASEDHPCPCSQELDPEGEWRVCQCCEECSRECSKNV